MPTDELASLLLIAAAAAAAPLLADLVPGRRVPVVVLEILLGIAIGPHVLDLVEPDQVVAFLADFGLGFLFFLAGMEIDFVRIRGRPARLGVFGWLVSFALALAIGGLLVLSGFVVNDLLIAVALSTTAIGTLVPILSDAGELDTPLAPYVLAAGVAGELGPIIAISLFLSHQAGPGVNAVILLLFALLVVGLAVLATRARPGRVIRLARRTMHSSGQFAVRLSVLVLVGLLFLTGEFGLDVVLGAFAAGVVVGLVTHSEEAAPVRHRLEGIGFGFVIPIFFIVSGISFDLPALTSSASSMLRLPVFLALLLVVRGVPVLLLYRGAVAPGDRLPFALLSATALPLIVAVTHIGLAEGRMHPANAAALVGAGMVSVLVFPAVAIALRGRQRGRTDRPLPAAAD